MSHGHDGDDHGHGHHDPSDWVKNPDVIYRLASKMPKKPYPGYKAPTLPRYNPNNKLGRPSVRVRWWHDWGIWAWVMLIVGIITFIFKWPYAFGYSVGWGSMMHWLLPGI